MVIVSRERHIGFFIKTFKFAVLIPFLHFTIFVAYIVLCEKVTEIKKPHCYTNQNVPVLLLSRICTQLK